MADDGPNPNIPAPELPDIFKSRIIAESGGESINEETLVLVIEKQLSASDVDQRQGRFNMHTVINNFLTDEEDAYLESRDESGKKNSMSVSIIEPCLAKSSVSLKRWAKKKNDPETLKYVLSKGWMAIVNRNRLLVGEFVRLWAVRVGGELWLALVTQVPIEPSSSQRWEAWPGPDPLKFTIVKRRIVGETKAESSSASSGYEE